ncbi:MAG: hypothetical protein ACREIA_19485, partial [Opitutaceae bacterium]
MAKEADSKKEAAAGSTAAPAGNGGWMPVLAVLVLVPALSFGMAQFLIFPKMEKMLAAATADGGATASHGSENSDAGSHGPKPEAAFSHEFKDIVSNLSGSMKSRYIKVSFTAYSAEPEFQHLVETNKAR